MAELNISDVEKEKFSSKASTIKLFIRIDNIDLY